MATAISTSATPATGGFAPGGTKTVIAEGGFAGRYGYGEDEWYGPTGLAMDREGGLIVSDVVTGRVRKIESAP